MVVMDILSRALLSSASSNGSDAMDPSLLLYRKRVFPPAALGVAASMGLASIFILLSLVKCCIKPRIYSIFEKMVTMLLMLGLAFVAATCLTWAGEQWLNLHQQSTNLTALLNVSLPSNVGYFFATMLTPLAATMQGQNFTSIPAFQKQTAAQMEVYAELNQTDLQGLFQQALEPVKAVAKQFPTATRCENVVIVRSSFSVMSVGAATGCFQCPKCAAITAKYVVVDVSSVVMSAYDFSIQQVELDWFRGVQAIHFILFQSHVNLIEFSTLALEPQLDAFQKSLHYTKEAVEVHTQRLSVMLASLTHSFALLLDYGLYTWWACSFVTSVTCVAAAIVGIKYKSGVVAKGASCLAQVSTLLGFGLTGVAWSLAFCARDGIELLQSFDQNATVLFPDATVSIGVSNLLHDQSLVANHSLTQLLSFADIVKVPPLATPQDLYAPPSRYDFAALFRFDGLVDLQARFDPTNPTVLESLFSWDEGIVASNKNLLTTLIDGNQTTPSPYAGTLVNLTAPHTMTSLLSTFNATWPSLTTTASTAQNERIASQWLVCSTFEMRRRDLLDYVSNVSSSLALTRPVIDAIQANTSRLEALEYQLKAGMEYYTKHIQRLKLADCGYNGNCVWARSIWNSMVVELMLLGNSADLATTCFGAAAVSQLLCAMFASCFATRIQKPKVKIYVFEEEKNPRQEGKMS